MKALGIYFSSIQKIKDEKAFYNIISNIQGVLNLRKIRNLILEGREVVYKILAISKIVFLVLLTKIPDQVVKELEKIQKCFLRKNSTSKTKHEIQLPSGQRIRENIKMFSSEKFYFENKT